MNMPTATFTAKAMDAFSLAELQKDHAECKDELLQIHAITQCVAECPPVTDSDTATVKAVKQMAFEIVYLEAQLNKLKEVK